MPAAQCGQSFAGLPGRRERADATQRSGASSDSSCGGPLARNRCRAPRRTGGDRASPGRIGPPHSCCHRRSRSTAAASASGDGGTQRGAEVRGKADSRAGSGPARR